MTTTSTPTRFRRSERDKVIGGVAGGLGRYLGVDPVIVRLLFAVTALAGGFGIVAYVLAWVIVPADDDPALDRPATSPALGGDAGRIGGVVLVVLALFALGDGWWGGELLLPLALVGAGVWLLVRPDKRDDGTPGAETAVAESTAHVAGADAPLVDAPPAPAEPVSAWAPPPPTAHRDTDRGFPTGRATTGLVALLGGVLGIAAANGADISLEAALIACLGVCGAGLVVGAWTGRARGLIALAVPLVFALGAASAIDVPFEGGVGERRHRPGDLAELRDEYRLGVGELVLDLRDLDAADLRGTEREIEATVAVGSLQVILPPGASATGEASAELGDVNVLGARSDGADAERQITVTGPEGGPMFALDLRVGLGEVIVR